MDFKNTQKMFSPHMRGFTMKARKYKVIAAPRLILKKVSITDRVKTPSPHLQADCSARFG